MKLRQWVTICNLAAMKTHFQIAWSPVAQAPDVWCPHLYSLPILLHSYLQMWKSDVRNLYNLFKVTQLTSKWQGQDSNPDLINYKVHNLVPYLQLTQTCPHTHIQMIFSEKFFFIKNCKSQHHSPQTKISTKQKSINVIMLLNRHTNLGPRLGV